MLIEPHVIRDSTNCHAGTAFYSCVANKFRGCCSTDPCSLLFCPDKMGSMKDPKDESEIDPTASGSKGGDRKGDEADATSTAATSKPTKTTTMTDSGITHTIPNNSVVTVTRHTTITTRKPTPTTSSDDDFASSTDAAVTETIPPTSEATLIPSSAEAGIGGDYISNGPATGPLSPGAIVGIGVGGAMVIAISVILIFTLIRRQKKRRSDTRSTLNGDNGRDDLVEEKHFPQPVSAHTTGTQGSSDPFAPFGGRADQPEDPYRPPSGTFEMDGTSAAPIELPAISTPGPSTTTRKAPRLEPVQEIVPSDPRANLTSLMTDSGKPAYVNHWNQYKNLG